MKKNYIKSSPKNPEQAAYQQNKPSKPMGGCDQAARAAHAEITQRAQIKTVH